MNRTKPPLFDLATQLDYSDILSYHGDSVFKDYQAAANQQDKKESTTTGRDYHKDGSVSFFIEDR